MYPIEFFFRAANQHADRIAIQGPDSRITYRELAGQVRSLAVAMQSLDQEQQTRVAICAGNTADHVTAILAAIAAGKIWVPLNYKSTLTEIERILRAVEPTIVISDDGGHRLVSSYTDTTHWSIGKGHTEISTLIESYRGAIPTPVSGGRDGIQAIKFTGGTTGAPKGVMQPYRAWTAGIINQIHGWQISADDCFVVTAPVTHGTSTYLLPILAQGARLLFLEQTNPASVARGFREFGGTISFMPPTLIYMLMSAKDVNPSDFSTLRCLIYGGAPMPVEKIDAARAYFGNVIGTTYGQTEAPQIVTMLRPEELIDPRNRSSAGACTWLSEIAIMSPTGNALQSGEIGEVVVRGDLVMLGYWRMPDKTRETIVDGWLHTGDVGCIDERGFLFIKDRIRDVIITGGFNVYPIDVENALSEHPAVHEASVFGIADEKWGESVQAAVQLRPGASTDEASLMAHVKAKLGSVQTPKRIYFLNELPRSSVGKVLKKDIKEKILNAEMKKT